MDNSDALKTVHIRQALEKATRATCRWCAKLLPDDCDEFCSDKCCKEAWDEAMEECRKSTEPDYLEKK